MSQEIYSKSTIHTKRNLLITSFTTILYSIGVININKAPFFGGAIENELLFSIALILLILYLTISTIAHIRFNELNEKKLLAFENFKEAEDEFIRILHSKMNEILKENIVYKELPFDKFKQELVESKILEENELKIPIQEEHVKKIIQFKLKEELSNTLGHNTYGVGIINLYKPNYLDEDVVPLIKNTHYKIKTAKTNLINANKSKFFLKKFEIYIPIIITGFAIGSLIIKIKSLI